jgi:BirA family biotin operon repressor/biotin-[acetyl-CoA-carboxylase] ligase
MKHFEKDIASTNKWLMDLARAKKRDGMPLPDLYAVYTDFQSAGRGAGTNTWHSTRGLNILTSIYFETGLTAADQFVFNLWFATSTRRFLSRYIPDVLIKWPNDMYVRDHKLAGDLTEHCVSGGRLDFTIAGIGINVNEEVFPPEIPHPTSLLTETGHRHSVDALMDDYLNVLQSRRSLLTLDHAPELRNEYLSHLYRLNEPHPYLINGQQVECTIRDIDRFGQLVLEHPDGIKVAYGFKEVGYVV